MTCVVERESASSPVMHDSRAGAISTIQLTIESKYSPRSPASTRSNGGFWHTSLVNFNREGQKDVGL